MPATIDVPRRVAAAVTLAIVTGSCAHRVVYTPPAVAPPPAAFKEGENWKPAEPRDEAVRGPWWNAFNDPLLNDLEAAVDVSNENLKSAEAQYAEARALVRGARSNLYPQVTAAPGVIVGQASGTRSTSTPHDVVHDIVLPVDASYEVDAWGRIREGVRASVAFAQASAADLETARLSVHAELAVDYFTLKGLDADKQLLDSAVAADEQALELTQTRFQGGLASGADVAQAETQLESTRAQSVDVQIARSTFEHAIAVLTGRMPSDLDLARAPLDALPPPVAPIVPSSLLERRPDVAAAERRVAAATAQLGAATAALYPMITRSGSAGFESSTFGRVLTGTSSLWSLGASALVNVFDAGRRRAVTEQARANYDQAAAVYRQSVLSAFRDVEDELVSLRILEEEAAIQDRATAAAERSLDLATTRYRGGVTSYLEVITANNAALSNERAGIGILVRRMTSAVGLFKALGGGWDTAMLPGPVAVAGK